MKLLTKEELKDLTGYSSPPKVIKVLIMQGIGFVTDVNGNVKTTWDAVNSTLIGSNSSSSIQPNFEHFG